MTDEEFASKVEWEGGLYEALFGYGLKSSDLDDEEGALAKAVREVEVWAPAFVAAMDRVEVLLEEAQERQ